MFKKAKFSKNSAFTQKMPFLGRKSKITPNLDQLVSPSIAINTSRRRRRRNVLKNGVFGLKVVLYLFFSLDFSCYIRGRLIQKGRLVFAILRYVNSAGKPMVFLVKIVFFNNSCSKTKFSKNSSFTQKMPFLGRKSKITPNLDQFDVLETILTQILGVL